MFCLNNGKWRSVGNKYSLLGLPHLLFPLKHHGGEYGGRRVAPPHRRGKKIPQSILQLKMKRCHKLNRRLKLVMGVTFLYRVFSIVILVKYIKCNLILKINF